MDSQGLDLAIIAILLPSALIMIGLVYKTWSQRTERAGRELRGKRAILSTPRRLLPDWFWPISGHTLLLDRDNMTDKMETWADTYNGNYELHILGKRVVIVTDPSEMRRMLLRRPTTFKRGLFPGQYIRAACAMKVMPSIFFDEGKSWGCSRRTLSPSFKAHNMDTILAPAVATIAESLCSKWRTHADSGEVVDALDYMCRYTHDIIFLIILGLRTNSVDHGKDRPSPIFDAYGNLIETLWAISTQSFTWIIWTYFSYVFPWGRKARRSWKLISTTVWTFIGQARNNMEDNQHGNTSRPESNDEAFPLANAMSASTTTSSSGAGGILQNLLSFGTGGRTTSKENTLSDDHLVREMMTLFFAGTDTTSKTLSWALYFLAKEPEVQARCRLEALQVAPQTEGLVSTTEQWSRLIFCYAVFKETLRLKPPVPTIFLHTDEGMQEEYSMQNGLQASKNMGFILLTRYAARSEEAFTRAKEFIPERWIEAEREEALSGRGIHDEERTVRHREDMLLAFGGGPRMCMGQNLAKLEGVIALAAICAQFKISLAPGQADPPREKVVINVGPESLKLVLTKA